MIFLNVHDHKKIITEGAEKNARDHPGGGGGGVTPVSKKKASKGCVFQPYGVADVVFL